MIMDPLITSPSGSVLLLALVLPLTPSPRPGQDSNSGEDQFEPGGGETTGEIPSRFEDPYNGSRHNRRNAEGKGNHPGQEHIGVS